MPIGKMSSSARRFGSIIPTSSIFMAVSSATRHASAHLSRFRSTPKSDHVAKSHLTASSAKASLLKTKSSLDTV